MVSTQDAQLVTPVSGSSELWRTEDWWSVWTGLGIVLIAYGLYANGSSKGWLAVSPGKYSIGS